MNELALFAGAGGGILGGILLGFKTVCAVEIDPYCQRVLMQRQDDGCLEPFPVWGDIRSFNGKPWAGIVDVVTAGFPCQPFSQAGKRLGIDDERNLWPETIRCIRDIRPRYALLENVPGLLANPYFGTILTDLAEAGFDVEWGVFGARHVGAPHKRNRLWILAHSNQHPGIERRDDLGSEGPRGRNADRGGLLSDVLADSDSRGLEEQRLAEYRGLEGASGDLTDRRDQGRWWDGAGSGRWWDVDPAEGPVESRVGRVAHGVADRMERLRAIGNGQVPRVVEFAWKTLTGEL